VEFDWKRCGNDRRYCNFLLVGLEKLNYDGVYIIWHEGTNGQPGRVVRVGQGNIANRLGVHRNDKAITQYSKHGELRVTWAHIPDKATRCGVEKYLADAWTPLVGDAFPDVAPIAVNSPFD
jgi:hypothetical protein